MVAHNAKFDVSFIRQNAVNLGLEFDYEIVDTLSLARELLPHLANHKLHTVANELEIDLLNAHRAEDDATATAKIFLKFVEMQSGVTIETKNKNNKPILRLRSKKVLLDIINKRFGL